MTAKGGRTFKIEQERNNRMMLKQFFPNNHAPLGSIVDFVDFSKREKKREIPNETIEDLYYSLK
ncbi:hypothetical protein CHS0354_028104, partial [Potamilus streckersoni]